MATKKVTGSQAVILSLLEEGVDTIFGYPGGAIMPIYDALYDFDQQVTHILTRHEQGAVHAAEGYAKVTGRAGVCFATSGPGATNLITGIADAMIDSIPLVCITGQVASPLLGTDAFQESDVVGISMPITKWNYQITDADEIPEAIAKAFYIATTGRPGPVLLDIAKDAQFQELDFEYKKCTKIRSYIRDYQIDPFSVKAAADLIDAAKKPFLLFGQGVIIANAEAELKTFIEKTGIPAAWTLLGLSALPSDHPLNVGMLGMHGNYGPNVKTNEADLIIAVGMRFDDRVTGKVSAYAKNAKIIHLEIDPAEIGKIVKTDVAVLGNAKKSLAMLIDNVKENKHESWLQEFRECDKIEYKKVISKDIYPEKGGLTMGEAVRIASEKTNNEAILVTDVGQHQMVAARYFKFKHSKSIVTSGGLGTMGYGIPAAMGAQLGAKNRTVVAFVGDGGFQMTLQELGTIVQNKLPVKIVLLNNNFLGMVRQWQQLFFEKRYSFTELQNPDFIMITNGFGMAAHKVTKREELEAGIQKMLDHNGPYLLEVVVEKEDNVFPMVPSGASVSDVILEA
ncbi:MAG: acetolactate synthase, large subunit, biosynthetic type [Bacteroidetes bacterium GWF2_42_66]|nr:MAG: acetolactate synthase, large subunit, biosynthetic type [Bacteroidetes bacterium GWA2_42_15]OFY00120.1 MAG: acetolactate synthase, large subunit, biosynthetic type [Bacteroidetes bacterium GWE2_42_39]OFY40263.1 MAG: acetolactate synthase, large subunit, biosynthetic type [Bacteroidetes bacterium GWF2_42_66]HBL73759.1 biosynthetic-type acetolactate synthase large subunit [Prolixibacteraceae bacterium]HCR88937.1 biosynthetic-type acetolactate synthase large subunit [Prolixibacteraceae bac